MRKPFLDDLIFFLSISVGTGIFQCLLSFAVGPDLMTQPSFANFFLLNNVISLLAALMVLRSYHNLHYRMAFRTGLIAFFTSLLRVILVYCILAPITKVFQQYYPLVLIIDLSAILLAACGLAFSGTGRNVWLRSVGMLSILTSCISLALVIWWMQVSNGRSTSGLEKWQLCLSFVTSLQPLLLIVYFWQLRDLQSKSDKSQTSKLTSPQITIRLLCIGLFMFLGISLMGEGMRAIRPQPQAIAQSKLFEGHIFKRRHGDTLSYRLLIPEDYDPKQRYPLLVSLHGGAGYGTDNIRQLASWEIQKLTEPQNRRKYPAFILAPQISHGNSWGGLSHLVSRDSIVFDLLQALEAEYSIDHTRLYVAGHSLGGYGTWHFIKTHPGVFAAAIPLSGAGDPALAKNLVHTALWAFHGANDENVPVEGTRAMITAIRRVGGQPRYTEFPGVGHYLNPSLNATPGIFDWLFAQKRENNP